MRQKQLFLTAATLSVISFLGPSASADLGNAVVTGALIYGGASAAGSVTGSALTGFGGALREMKSARDRRKSAEQRRKMMPKLKGIFCLADPIAETVPLADGYPKIIEVFVHDRNEELNKKKFVHFEQSSVKDYGNGTFSTTAYYFDLDEKSGNWLITSKQLPGRPMKYPRIPGELPKVRDWALQVGQPGDGGMDVSEYDKVYRGFVGVGMPHSGTPLGVESGIPITLPAGQQAFSPKEMDYMFSTYGDLLGFCADSGIHAEILKLKASHRPAGETDSSAAAPEAPSFQLAQ